MGLFTSQGSGVGSTSGSSTTLTLTATAAADTALRRVHHFRHRHYFGHHRYGVQRHHRHYAFGGHDCCFVHRARVGPSMPGSAAYVSTRA